MFGPRLGRNLLLQWSGAQLMRALDEAPRDEGRWKNLRIINTKFMKPRLVLNA